MAAPPQLRALLQAVNTLLRKRRYHAVLAILKGLRNGAVYGVKIRAPHALVMTFLFRSGSLQEKLQAILKATYTHSWNLAWFVFTYKSLCALQSHVQGETHQMHPFLAAFIGGLLLFGKNNNINSQTSLCSCGACPGSCSVDQAGLELTEIHLALLLECGDQRSVPTARLHNF